MRRGLMRWESDELPLQVLAERLARLRTAMRRERLDAFVIYTNLVRPAAVCWLTGFTPYWSEGALLVLAEGQPIFATALSKRVATWIESTNRVSEVLTGPRPGKALGARLAQAGATRVGVLEYDVLPTALADDLAEAAPSASFIEASAMFAQLRCRIDAAEHALLTRADTIARDALAHIEAGRSIDAGAVAGEVEKQARLAGAEEAYVAVAPDLAADQRCVRASRPVPLGNGFAVRLSVAYKGCWIRRAQTFAQADAAQLALAETEAAFTDALTRLGGDKPLGAQLMSFAQAGSATLRNWLAEGAIGSYPLQPIAAKGMAADAAVPNDFLVLTLTLTVNGQPWVGAAPVLAPLPAGKG